MIQLASNYILSICVAQLYHIVHVPCPEANINLHEDQLQYSYYVFGQNHNNIYEVFTKEILFKLLLFFSILQVENAYDPLV